MAGQRFRPLARALAFIRLGRPLFLVGGFVLYGLGATLALAAGRGLSLRLYVLGQAAVTAFQLMTHYANDYFDYEADRANATPTRWSGGSRVLAAGELPMWVALAAALVLAALGITLALILARQPGVGPGAVPVLLATLALSWEYSAPPLRLHSTGLGELVVVAVVTGLVPLLGYYLQAGDLRGVGHLLLAIAPLGALQFAMLLAIEFPDARGDEQVGKRTLVVRLGPARAARLYNVVTAAAYLFLPLAAWLGLPAKVAWAAAATAPIAAFRIYRMAAGDFADPGRWEAVTFFGVALLVATSIAELGALLFL